MPYSAKFPSLGQCSLDGQLNETAQRLARTADEAATRLTNAAGSADGRELSDRIASFMQAKLQLAAVGQARQTGTDLTSALLSRPRK